MNRHETWCAVSFVRNYFCVKVCFFAKSNNKKKTQKHFSKQNVLKKLVESTCVNWFLCTLDWTHVTYLIAGGRECWRRCKGQIVLLNDEMKVIDMLSWCDVKSICWFTFMLNLKIKLRKQATYWFHTVKKQFNLHRTGKLTENEEMFPFPFNGKFHINILNVRNILHST